MKPFQTVELDLQHRGPLHGITVLDLSRLVAGNMLTASLADLGADVIKVEPLSGDTLREWKTRGISTVWKTYARNKRSLCLDFHSPKAAAVVLRLAAGANIFVESFRPGRLESMGLAPPALHQVNPALVIARVSGWGQTGPYSALPGFGTLVEGLSGFASMNGFADREPVLPPIYLGDMTAGLYGALGVMAALRHAEQTGEGQVVDVSLLEPLVAVLGAQAANYRLTGKVKQRTGSRSTNSAPRNVYSTADGEWICLSASTQGMAERLFRVIGRDDLVTDPRYATNSARVQNVESLDAMVSAFTSAHTLAECLSLLQEGGVTAGPLYDMSQIEKDEHFHQRDVYVELADKEMGSVPVHNITPRLSKTPGNFRRVAPELGEHTIEILNSAGLSQPEIRALLDEGVVRA